MEKQTISVTDLGALCDGSQDSTDAFIKAVNTAKRVLVPFGRYTLSKTLVLPDECELAFDRGAAVFATDSMADAPMIAAQNAVDISIRGGVFHHPYRNDGGAVLDFGDISGLVISDTDFFDCNGSCISFERVADFSTNNISFSSLSEPRGGGVVIHGGCHHGSIGHLFAKTPGQTHLAFVTLNAKVGDIRSITIRDLCADSCGGFIEMRGCGKISDISVCGIYGGTECVLMIPREVQAHGISISELEIYSVSDKGRPLIDISGSVRDLFVRDFSRPGLIDSEPFAPSVRISESMGASVRISGLCPECALRAFRDTKAKIMGLDFSESLYSLDYITAKDGEVICPDGGFSRLYIN